MWRGARHAEDIHARPQRRPSKKILMLEAGHDRVPPSRWAEASEVTAGAPVVTAVVPAYRRPVELDRCLASLLAEAGLTRVIIVNNGGLAINSVDARVTVIDTEANLGVGGGYREGIEQAIMEGSTWIWLLDDDAWVEPGALGSMMSLAVKWPRTPSAMVPEVRDEAGSPSLPPARRKGTWLLRFGRVNLDSQGGQPSEVAIAAWAGLLVRSAAVQRVGLPDARMFVDTDDVEFTYRLGDFGPIVLVPGAIVRHPVPADGGSTLPLWRMYYDIRNTLVFLFRHQRRRWLWPVEFLRLWMWQLVLITRSPAREWLPRSALLVRAVADGVAHRLGPRRDGSS